MAKQTRNRFNPTEVKRLYNKLKNVNAVAKELGGSYMGIRRNLIAQGVDLVPARGVAQASATRQTTPSKSGSKIFGKDEIATLSRAIASAIMGDATVQIKPTTREELWGSINTGVQTGMRQIGFR